eukprot:IDg17196t1
MGAIGLPFGMTLVMATGSELFLGNIMLLSAAAFRKKGNVDASAVELDAGISRQLCGRAPNRRPCARFAGRHTARGRGGRHTCKGKVLAAVQRHVPARLWLQLPGVVWRSFLLGNLLPVSLGNIVAGVVFVSFLFHFAHQKKTRAATVQTSADTAALVAATRPIQDPAALVAATRPVKDSAALVAATRPPTAVVDAQNVVAKS